MELDEGTEALVRQHAALVTEPAGERILAELERLRPRGFFRLAELGMLAPLGGELDGLARVELLDRPGFLLVAVFGSALEGLPISNELRRYERNLLRAEAPQDRSPRSIHRFRRQTEPWALDAVAFLGGDAELALAVEDARAARARPAARSRRRARSASRAGDRSSAGADRGGAGSRNDCHSRGGIGARAPGVGAESLMNTDAVRARFAATAGLVAAHADERADWLADHVRRFVEPRGDERALDAGTGSGAVAFALAPLVREVVGVDFVPELLAEARDRAGPFPNVEFVEGDITSLAFADESFDLAATVSTIHHVARPELVVAELVRVTRPGGRILVADQVAPVDPLAALELNRFEHARDPSHVRVLADVDLRYLFDSNNLVFRRAEFVTEQRELEPFFDRAGCTGEARERARALAPSDETYTVTFGWYLLKRSSI